MSVRLRYDKVDKYIVNARLNSPMHIGSGETSRQEILIHPSTGLPFVQASSITGALRDYYEKRFRDADILFGSIDDVNEHAKIKVSDGIFSDKSVKRIEYRPRVKIDPVSGSVAASKVKGTNIVSGHKFDTEYVGTGAEFSFIIYVYRDESYDTGIDEKLIRSFAALNNGEIVLGGQKSSGCGDVSILHLYHRLFDLRDQKERSDWMREDELLICEENYDDIIGQLNTTADTLYRIRVNGRIESSVLVKGYQVDGFGQNAPDSVNIKNSNKDYIIPGTSLKGVIRSRVDYIVRTLEIDKKVLDEIFGSATSDESERGVTGNARFYDTVIGTAEDNDKNEISHRIHVDKFTGGVIYKALFSEKTAAGDINDIRIDITNKNNPERSVGLILLALRDLAKGMINLGGGYHIGHGFVDVNSILVEYGDQRAKINYKTNQINDTGDVIGKCLQAVKREALDEYNR